MPVDFDLDMPQYMQKDNAYMIPKESIPTAGHERKTESTQEEAHTEGPPDEKMNIVLLYADDWTYKTLGAAGNTFVKTPNLDELAKQGIMFTHNCVTTAICWISRATLYTGQYASRHRGVMPDAKGFFVRWNETLYGDRKSVV